MASCDWIKNKKKINGFKRSKDPHPQLVFLWILWAGTEQRARKKNGGEGKKMKNTQQNKKKYRNHLLPPYGARGQLDSTEELKATTFVVNYYYYRDLFCFVFFL